MTGDWLTDKWLDDRLETWLEDGPQPSEALLAGTLEAVSKRRQRRWLRWPSRPLRVVAYGATAVVVTAVAVVFVGSIARPGDTRPGGEASETATPTPGWDARFPSVYVGDFSHPFTFAIDPASGIILTSWPDPYQFRVQRGPNLDNFDEGVIVHSVGNGLRSDVCREAGGDVDAKPTPEQVIAAIQSLDGLAVSDVTPTIVDGRRALAVTVSGTEHRTCDAYFLFDGMQPAFAFDGNEGRTRRVIAVDVGDDVVLVTITASDERYDAWVPIAEAFIDSIHFDPP